MRKEWFFIFLCIGLAVSGHKVIAQACGTRQLDPRISSFLKLVGKPDLSLEQLRSLSIEQIRFVGLPPGAYPQTDVTRIKVTTDSIPVLVFNPAHARNLPIIINYHGGGFISPL